MGGGNRPQVMGDTAAGRTSGVYATRTQSWCQPGGGRIVTGSNGGQSAMREWSLPSSGARPARPAGGGRGWRVVAAALAGLVLLPAAALTAEPAHIPRRHLETAMEASSDADTVRFLEQATFGPTDALIAHVQEVGFDAGTRRAVRRADVLVPEPGRRCRRAPRPAARPAARPPAYRDNYTMYPLQVRFFKNALDNDDQLRQRVALALHEILVVSGRQGPAAEPGGAVPRLAARRRLRELPHDPLRRDAQPRDGALPRHGEQRRPGAAVERLAERELRPRSDAAVLDRGEHAEPRRLAACSTPSAIRSRPIRRTTIEDFAHVFTGWTYAPIPGASGRAQPAEFSRADVLYRDATGKDAEPRHGGRSSSTIRAPSTPRFRPAGTATSN